MKTYIDLALLAVALYFGYFFVKSYIAAQGSVWQRFLAAGHDSATLAWNRLVIIGVSTVDGSVYLSDALGQTGIADKIQANLSPTYVAAFIVFISALTLIARLRTLARGS